MNSALSRSSAAHRLLLLAGAVLLMGGWAGCATAPGGSVGAPTELHTASDDSPTRARARTRLALATGYFENNQTTIALDELKKVLAVDPSFGDAYNLGGLIYMKLGEMAMAESHFARAISANPRDANAMHNLGWLQCQQGRYPEATASFQRAIAVPSYQGRARTLMTQGICESRAGDNARAEATLMHSYELDAGNPVTAYNLSALLYKRGDYQRAQFYIRRLNNSELANAESLWLGIRVERRMNNRQAMEQLASQLRRRFPQSRELLAYERGAFDD
ncbi:type IV pilus biogenesis/stability protein PilW [Ottowia sp. GY511]|uniref:Type IV pilus biogenesis/stability protein PilW n=1 Tax=Ottowia flava TaxID=2675430 RepID=A0ABW4KSK4_9BURK|nr:type IV pilus biogenesis/stability protein PilW [Ottowia sp. GY511]TXK33669.1 type IV pilus biogenesis/stability protein PilW [Ottowia sp. GY511]